MTNRKDKKTKSDIDTVLDVADEVFKGNKKARQTTRKIRKIKNTAVLIIAGIVSISVGVDVFSPSKGMKELEHMADTAIETSEKNKIQNDNNLEYSNLDNEELLNLEYEGKPYVILSTQPKFEPEELQPQKSYQEFTPLDELNRVGEATALIDKNIMPTEKRGDISSIKPTGWHNKKYDFVNGGYVYNRCHLIGFQLTGENDNWLNLMTGTRTLNVEGMLPFENEVADYVNTTGEQVRYTVTPIFKDDELVARGVRMKGCSVKDNCEEVGFDVYVFNNEPGVDIDYATGRNYKKSE